MRVAVYRLARAQPLERMGSVRHSHQGAGARSCVSLEMWEYHRQRAGECVHRLARRCWNAQAAMRKPRFCSRRECCACGCVRVSARMFLQSLAYRDQLPYVPLLYQKLTKNSIASDAVYIEVTVVPCNLVR